jgi:hypothetical protein
VNPEQFCYWLHGFFEIACPIDGLSPTQIATIRDHLDLVFTKVTPDRKAPKKVILSEQQEPEVAGDPDARKRFQEMLDELKRSRPGVTCQQVNPFDPHPKIC